MNEDIYSQSITIEATDEKTGKMIYQPLPIEFIRDEYTTTLIGTDEYGHYHKFVYFSEAFRKVIEEAAKKEREK